MSVLGVGTYTPGPFKAKVRGKNTAEYQIWRDMLRRCYSPEALLKGPSYAGCTVSEDFLNFQTFAAWAAQQIGFGLPDYHMDKDLLFPGNRVYSAETIVFVPEDLNVFLTSSAAKRGAWPQGVSWKKKNKKFVAQIKFDAKVVHLGLFKDLEQAKAAYAAAKTSAGREWGRRLREGVYPVDPRVTAVLSNYVFSHEVANERI